VKRFTHSWLDDSQWPLLVVTYPADPPLEDVVSVFSEVDAFYKRNSDHFAWVVDASRVQHTEAKARKATSEHEARSKDHMRQFNCGTAFIIKSTLVRGILTAIFWLAPPAYPYEIFSDLASARDWSLRQLRSRTQATSRERPI
jgi:hypothetical protein